jgi:hypothetical protein
MKYRHFSQLCAEMRDYLQDRRQPFVTTFFDYYGLPLEAHFGWDFVTDAKRRGGVEAIERALAAGVASAVDDRQLARFIPYVQLHEFEALYFAEPAVLAAVLEAPDQAEKVAEIVVACGGCESINDSPATAPSKRIQRLFPHYIKGRSATAHAPRLGTKLALARIRAACPRFHRWVCRLEELAPTRTEVP